MVGSDRRTRRYSLEARVVAVANARDAHFGVAVGTGNLRGSGGASRRSLNAITKAQHAQTRINQELMLLSLK